MHGPAIDQILADENALGDILWLLTDHLGTVRDLAQYDDLLELTEIANHITYDSFGNVTSETNSAVDHLFGFTGRERDQETGLNYHRNRYYDPHTGSWISQDPIGFEAGDENLYRYVGGSPTNATDPSGFVKEFPGTPNQGVWSDTPGDSWFRPTDKNGNLIPGAPAVRYHQGAPDFTPWIWAHGDQIGDVEIELDDTMCTDTPHEADIRASRDRAAAIKEMRARYGKQWRMPKGYVWHHQSVENGVGRMILVSNSVHNPRYSHWGAFQAHAEQLRTHLGFPTKRGMARGGAIFLIGIGISVACGQDLYGAVEDSLDPFGPSTLGDAEIRFDYPPDESEWEALALRQQALLEARWELQMLLLHGEIPRKENELFINPR